MDKDALIDHAAASLRCLPMPTNQPLPRITVIILTYNEERHLARAIASLKPLDPQIVVVDSHSTDRTVEIAQRLGANVLSNRWEQNYARQFNWALDHAQINGDWVMRLDADEYLTHGLVDEMLKMLPLQPTDVSGVYVRRRIHFLGKWIRWGGVYPMWVLRIWRSGHARCEARWMDEHMQLLAGKSVRFQHDLIDENLNDLTWWTTKHNGYSTREVVDLLNVRHDENKSSRRRIFAAQSTVRRWMKERIYIRLPLFVRAVAYFLMRYFLKLGFLDGRPGLVWHVLQGLWYRFLVDAKVYEAERRAGANDMDVREYIEREWGLK